MVHIRSCLRVPCKMYHERDAFVRVADTGSIDTRLRVDVENE